MLIGLVYKAPIAFAPQIRGPLARLDDIGHVVRSACLEQQHAHVRILRQPTRHYRTGGARSAYDEVIIRFQLSRELLLVEPHSLREVCLIVIGETRINFSVCHFRDSSVSCWHGRLARMAKSILLSEPRF